MNIPASAITFLQTQLKGAGFDPGEADGDLGDNTFAAVARALRTRADAPAGWAAWPGRRQAAAYLQLLCKDREIERGEIDGYWGPQTDDAVESLIHLVEKGTLPAPWRDEEPDPVPRGANPQQWPRQAEPELIRFYGRPGENQTKAELPYPHRLAWDTSKIINSYTCHEKVEASLKRVLGRVLDHYGPDKIAELRLDYWGGSLNVRKMRGGTRWSMHSWGIAIDYDPERNQLKWGRDRAVFARPEYDAWWRLWEEEGWLSLGRARNYDWMHVQAARL